MYIYIYSITLQKEKIYLGYVLHCCTHFIKFLRQTFFYRSLEIASVIQPTPKISKEKPLISSTPLQEGELQPQRFVADITEIPERGAGQPSEVEQPVEEPVTSTSDRVRK